MAVVATLVVAPTLIAAWAGCSSSKSTGSEGRVQVDPGGTFGAEVTVTVVGRGRVTTTLPGLDCPSSCFARYVFPEGEGAGAPGIPLTAVAGKDVRFEGWKFEATPLGARGRGPESCNPVVRDSASPPVDLRSPAIVLPYGQVNGLPPTGKEAECSAFTSVPVAYNVTATFVDTVVDAGPDGDLDGGADLLFDSLGGGLAAKEIGVYLGRVYWRLDSGGLSAVASALPGATPTLVAGSSTTSAIDIFDVGLQHLVWQTTGGMIGIIQAGSGFTTATQFSSGGTVCRALATDSSNIFCRTTDSIVSWNTAGAAKTVVHSGLPLGNDFAVDSTSFYLADPTGGAGASVIKTAPRTPTVDGGVPTLFDIVTGLTNPIGVDVNSSRLYWIDYDDIGAAGGAKYASRTGGTATPIGAVTQGLKMIVMDPSSTFNSWVGVVPSFATGASSILRDTSASAVVFRQGLTGLGGIAADTSYVYWTQSDGRVFRASKF